MRKNYNDTDRESALNNCKMLYRDLHRPCTETCMCWGWEFGRGWDETVRELSTKLEALNLEYYKKYGVCVVMDQCKEKYGTLHAYYHVCIDPPLIYRIWHKPFEWLRNKIRGSVDFGLKSVVDAEGYYTDEREEIPDDEVKDTLERVEHISNVKVEKLDEKFYTITHLWHIPRTHVEPTKNKFLWHVMNLSFKLSILLDFHKEPTPEQIVIHDAVESIASEYVRNSEEKCYNVCEDCGTQIGTDWSPRVTTKGWISYICESCDAKRRIRNAVSNIEYALKSGKCAIPESLKEVFNNAKSVLASDEYHSSKELKKIAADIESVAEQILNA